MAARKGRTPQRKRVVDAEGKITVRGRATAGSGSVFYVENEGVWRASYTVAGDDKITADGRRVQRVRYVRGRTQEEAIKRREEARARLAAELAPRSSRFTNDTTVGQLAAWWLANVAPDRVRATSLEAIRTRLTPGRLGALASVPVVALTVEEVTEWQAGLLRGDRPLAPKTVADTRTTLRQVIEVAVDHELVARNVVAKVKAPKVAKRPGKVLQATDVHRLIAAADEHRYGPVVAMLFLQGWRVSEVLGLAWSDVDLDAGTAQVRRAVVDVKGAGRMLGDTKTDGVKGVHELLPGVVDRLRRWKAVQAAERLAAGPLWLTHEYEGHRLDMVFTAADGGLVGRQTIDKLLRSVAVSLDIDPAGLGTHVGRRSVVTLLYQAGETLEDVARHVGHGSTATTAGYVASLGDRPKRTAQRAAELLDRPSSG